jgi:hypothetical protein
VTALFLTVAVVGIITAYFYRESPVHDSEKAGMAATRRAWLNVAGVAAGGIVLARPDGLVYVLIPVALVVTNQWSSPTRGGVSWFFSPLILLSSSFVLPFIVRNGLWRSTFKLDGRVALVFIAFQVVAAVVSMAADRFAIRFRSETVIAAMFSVIALAIATLVAVEPGQVAEAVGIMVANLVRDGGWGFFWVYAFSALLICVMSVPVSGHKWLESISVAIGLFFSFAVLIHGAMHPGRLGWFDSFNRLSFHIVPLVFLFVIGSATTMASVVVRARRGPG